MGTPGATLFGIFLDNFRCEEACLESTHFDDGIARFVGGERRFVLEILVYLEHRAFDGRKDKVDDGVMFNVFWGHYWRPSR